METNVASWKPDLESEAKFFYWRAELLSNQISSWLYDGEPPVIDLQLVALSHEGEKWYVNDVLLELNKDHDTNVESISAYMAKVESAKGPVQSVFRGSA